MTYYLKYRPQKLEDLDLKDVRETLLKTIKSGSIPHAFLFSGPKGSGKTSAARILAKYVNCENKRKNASEPCNKCDSCLAIANSNNIDVLELDAASHRGIDDIRTLRDAVKLAPARSKKKVYIIDEAHMLTKEASNALLKILEEPPEHVMFIMATTNPEKLIDTIRSRVFNVAFKLAKIDEITRSLSRVVKGEKIRMEKGVLDLIAEASDGSFRDAAKILEQLVTEKKKLKKDEIEEYLFQRNTLNVDKVILLLEEKDTKSLIFEIERITKQGASMRVFCEALIARLRTALLAKVGVKGQGIESFSMQDLVKLIKLFSKAIEELPSSVLDQIPVELAVIEWCEINKNGNTKNGDPGRDKLTKNSTKPLKLSKIAEQKPFKQATESVSKTVQTARASVKSLPEELWAQILSSIRLQSAATEALLRATKPLRYDGSTLTLGVFYKFHKEKLETGIHRRILVDIAGKMLGTAVRIECTLIDPPQRNNKTNKISNIIKDGELDKSDGVVLTEGEDDDIIKVAKEIFGS